VERRGTLAIAFHAQRGDFVLQCLQDSRALLDRRRACLGRLPALLEPRQFGPKFRSLLLARGSLTRERVKFGAELFGPLLFHLDILLSAVEAILKIERAAPGRPCRRQSGQLLLRFGGAFERLESLLPCTLQPFLRFLPFFLERGRGDVGSLLEPGKTRAQGIALALEGKRGVSCLGEISLELRHTALELLAGLCAGAGLRPGLGGSLQVCLQFTDTQGQPVGFVASRLGAAHEHFVVALELVEPRPRLGRGVLRQLQTVCEIAGAIVGRVDVCTQAGELGVACGAGRDGGGEVGLEFLELGGVRFRARARRRQLGLG